MKHILLAVLAIIFTTTVYAQDSEFSAVNVNSTETCVIPKVDGERVPFPVRKANTKFELAAGETYLLNGTLVNNSGKVMLRIDFNSQPWLATAKMLSYPYFEVTTMSASVVQQYSGRIVQVAVVAKGEDSCTTHLTNLKLDPILPPSISSH